ncbi:uncharacterized protein LOC143299142 [Babylonia areolata]|uniref:uncharacterized protein LOC143299142 n=1 Tax=Babylonia areolata TaxID=304850 RepID=UPI003FD346FF
MDIFSIIFAVSAVLLSHVRAQVTGTVPTPKEVEADWAGMVDCFAILTNQTSLPVELNTSPADVTIDLLKSICGTKEQFLSCVDHSLRTADENSVVHLFRPLFNITVVTEAYNDLCQNLTVTQSQEDLSCLINSTALQPCYTEYYNYLLYLSIVKRFGSPQRQLPEDVVNTLICTLAEERRDCEVAALNVCSTKIGDIMRSFYQKTLPSACIQENAPGTEDTTTTATTTATTT